MTRPRLTFEHVRGVAFANLEALCAKLLPSGRRKGVWHFARVPWREDSTPSLGVSFTTGRWQDWGRPGDAGTMIDLVMRLQNCTAPVALYLLADMLGISATGLELRPVKKPAVRKCRECLHAWDRFPELGPLRSRACTKLTWDQDEPMPTRLARGSSGRCGQQAKYFEPRNNATEAVK